MNKVIIFFFALLAITLSFNVHIRRDQIQQETVGAVPWPFTVCGTSSKWNIQKLTLAAQPSRNTNDDIDTLGSATDSITFKYVHLDVKLNGVPLHNEDVPFTDSYDDGDTVEFKYKNYIPSFAPPGTYGLTFNFKDKAGNDQGCLYFSFKL